MGYLIGQIILCLVIAALLGGIIGWLLRGNRCAQQTAELEAELEHKKRVIIQTQREASVARATRSNTASAGSKPAPLYKAPMEKDDLKKINGVGPVLEQTLNDLGITTFKQIANFTAEDVAKVTAALEGFTGRIERDDWIGGAKKEYQVKYSNSA